MGYIVFFLFASTFIGAHFMVYHDMLHDADITKVESAVFGALMGFVGAACLVLGVIGYMGDV